MSDEGLNRYLKDSRTVSILPAPPETRKAAGIAWYEVQLFAAERRVCIAAFD